MGATYSYYTGSNQPVARFGWKKPDNPPPENKYLKFVVPIVTSSVDLTLTKHFPAVYDQGNLGSCVSNSLLCSFKFDELNNDTSGSVITTFDPSRLYLNFEICKKEGHIGKDTGGSISDGILCLQTIGVCTEKSWRYDISKFGDTPDEMCNSEASLHKIVQFRAVRQSLQDIKSCIVAGFTVNIGFYVFEDIYNLSAANGWTLPMPRRGATPIGGHAVVVVGFNDDKKNDDNSDVTSGVFKIRNSWGASWGDNGHFYIPYDYVLANDLAGDFWVISQVEDLDNYINNRLVM